MLKVTHAVSLHLCNRCKSTWEINQSLLCKCPLLHFGYLRIWDLLQPLQHATLYLKIPKRKQLDFSTYILPFSKHTTSSSMLIQNTQHTPFCWDCCIAFVVVYKLISCLSNLSAITYSSSPVTFSVFYFLFTQSGFCSNGVCRQCSIKAITILFIILYLIVRFLKGFIFFASAVKGSLIHPISGWKCTDRQLNRTIWKTDSTCRLTGIHPWFICLEWKQQTLSARLLHHALGLWPPNPLKSLQQRRWKMQTLVALSNRCQDKTCFMKTVSVHSSDVWTKCA